MIYATFFSFTSMVLPWFCIKYSLKHTTDGLSHAIEDRHKSVFNGGIKKNPTKKQPFAHCSRAPRVMGEGGIEGEKREMNESVRSTIHRETGKRLTN